MYGVWWGVDDKFVILVMKMVYSKMSGIASRYRTRPDGLMAGFLQTSCRTPFLQKRINNSIAYCNLGLYYIFLYIRLFHTNVAFSNKKSIQLCLIRTDVDPKFLSGLSIFLIMHIKLYVTEGTGTFQSVRFRRKSGLHMSGLSRVACFTKLLTITLRWKPRSYVFDEENIGSGAFLSNGVSKVT